MSLYDNKEERRIVKIWTDDERLKQSDVFDLSIGDKILKALELVFSFALREILKKPSSVSIIKPAPNTVRDDKLYSRLLKSKYYLKFTGAIELDLEEYEHTKFIGTIACPASHERATFTSGDNEYFINFEDLKDAITCIYSRVRVPKPEVIFFGLLTREERIIPSAIFIECLSRLPSESPSKPKIYPESKPEVYPESKPEVYPKSKPEIYPIGIDGLAKILSPSGISGFEKPSKERPVSVLITGAPGSGKTILATQMLFEMAKNNVKCSFITTKDNKDIIKNIALTFGFCTEDDASELIDRLIRIWKVPSDMYINPFDHNNIMNLAMGDKENEKPDVIFIDSLNVAYLSRTQIKEIFKKADPTILTIILLEDDKECGLKKLEN